MTDEAMVSGPMRDEADMRESCTKALKVLLGECADLPTSFQKRMYDSGHLAQLPPPLNPLPREKAPPKPKPLTAWQKFAIKKGIDPHRKKENRVFDEERQVWKDKWGKRAREDREKYDWLREVKPGYVAKEDGGDPFLDDKRVKQEKAKVIKKKEDHNQRRAEHLQRAESEVKRIQSTASHLTTASNGKFDTKKTFKKGKASTKA